MKKFGLMLVLILVMIIAVDLNMKPQKQEQVLLETFKQSNCDIVKSNINTYAKLDISLKTFDEMERYLDTINRTIGGDFTNEVNTEQSDKIMIVEESYVSDNAKLNIKVETINKSDSYLIIDTTIYDNWNNLILIKEQIDIIFKKLNLDTNTSITMTGSYTGNIDYNRKREIALDIMDLLDAKVYEDYNTDRVYSVVGYTKKIKEYIYSQKQKININLVLRYNEYENKTYLYLATPLITTEY